MKNFAKLHLASIAGLLCLGFYSVQAAAVSTTNIIKLSQGANISAIHGEQLTVSVIGENFATGPNGAGFSLTWDPNVLSYVSGDIATPPWNALSNGSSIYAPSPASGSLDAVFLTMDSGNAGSNFAVASFTFTVTGLLGSSSPLTLANDVFSTGFIDGLNNLDVNYIESTVQVAAPQAVPIPAAFWMFAASLSGLGGLLRGLKPHKVGLSV